MIIEPEKLAFGRNDLNKLIEIRTPLENSLVTGRFLKSAFHDAYAPINEMGLMVQMHWYKKILKTYDPKIDAVLLSKQGSRRLIENLDKPDREYSKQELYEEALKMWWMVRESDHELF